jgi:hypothetical protein
MLTISLQNEHAEATGAALEFRFLRLRRQALDDVAECGLPAGREHDRGSGSADDRRSQKDELGGVRRRRRDRAVRRRLLCRQRFTGQRRLVHVQVVRCHETGIPGNQIAGAQPNEIAHHHVAPRHLDPGAVATDGRRRRDVRLQA